MNALGPFPPALFAAAGETPNGPDWPPARDWGEIRNTFATDSASPLGVLALDLGVNTGWALRPVPGSLVSGVQRFESSRFEGGGMRFLRFKQWLTETKQAGLSAVYFEEVVFHGKFNSVGAAHLYGGMLAILTAWCEHHSIPYRGIPVGTIKKSFAGKGNASKAEMIQAAKRQGYDVEDDNQADAIAILLYVESLVAPK